jgi:thiosulfate dehydrogenase [quinone] large subunit
MTILETPHPNTPATPRPRGAVASPGIEVVADTEPGAVTETGEHVAARYTFAVARISLGFVFLWAFVDKLFGLGYATPAAKAWIHGGSPSTGFLTGVKGPFGDVFHSIAGAPADWLFMAGLLGIGVALILGVGMRIAAVSGALLLVFMWAASLPIVTNPFLDDHLVYAVVLVGLALMHAGDTAGLGKPWSRLPMVKRFPVLR